MKNPLILTLQLDSQTFEYLNDLRKTYFPVNRNFIPAHITLFHALPSEQKDKIITDLQLLCSKTSIINLELSNMIFLGNGVAVEVMCKKLSEIKELLNKQWNADLIQQDKQKFRPHVTIQNKVSSEKARQLYNHLSNSWQSMRATSIGLSLWYYRGGPWEFIENYNFVKP